MHYRRFGTTELRMPVISCGAMRFQQSWNASDAVSEESQQNLEACVRRALDLGINHFETARGYGTSEAQLGRILPQLPRDEILVQTKVGPQKDVKQFAEGFEDSMKRLRLHYLDMFAFHGINTPECLDNTMRCLDQARQWQRQGRVRHIGFSTHGPCDIIIKAIQTGAFEYVNLHWFYVFQGHWPAVEEARKRDMGVFIISPNEKAGLLFSPSEKLAKLTAPLHPMAFNGLFCLARPDVHSLSAGVSRPEHFDVLVDAVVKLDQAAQVIAPIEARLQREMERTLGKEWLETWHVGLPEWHETPGQINIPWILRLHNLVAAFDMVEFAKMRYNLLGNGGHWFPGNRADKLSEVDLTECLRRSPHAAAIPEILAETHALLAGEERKRLQRD